MFQKMTLEKAPCQYKQETEDPRNNEQQDKNAHRFSICIGPPSTKDAVVLTLQKLWNGDSIFTFSIS